MSIEVMKLALDALEHHGGHLPWNAFVEVRKDLRTAIQQAAEGEPVAWIRRHPNGALSNELLIHVQVEQLRRDSGAWVPLYTHPAPGVPDDVVRDAKRYRWLKAYDHNSEDMGICKWVDEGWSGQWVLEHDPDTSIDAAMLAAK